MRSRQAARRWSGVSAAVSSPAPRRGPTVRLPHRQGEQPAGEAYAEVPVEPAQESSPLRVVVVKQVDPLADLADRDHAQVAKFFRRRFDPIRTRRLGRGFISSETTLVSSRKPEGLTTTSASWTCRACARDRAAFRPSARIERNRPVMLAAARARSTDRTPRPKQDHSLAPLLTTRCGPSARTCLKSSLKRAFAS